MSAWDKLSMFERADIMKLAVKSGVYNLDAIRNGYNKFAEGGDTGNKLPIGGPILIGTAARGAVKAAKQRLYENLSPIGYEDLSRVPKAIFLNEPDVYHNTMKNMPVLDEIYAQYLGIPEEHRHFDTRLEKSKYKPSQGGEDVTYYRLPQKTIDGRTILGDDHKYTGISDTSVDTMVFDATYMNPGENKQQLNTELGYYTVGRGRDNKGDYVSYYDKWDINPFSGRLQNHTAIPLSIRKTLKDINLDFGVPVNIYDRIYFDDYYGIKGDARGGHYLPEIIVTGKKNEWKHAFGGPIPKATRATPTLKRKSWETDEEYKERISSYSKVDTAAIIAENQRIREENKRNRQQYLQTEEGKRRQAQIQKEDTKLFKNINVPVQNTSSLDRGADIIQKSFQSEVNKAKSLGNEIKEGAELQQQERLDKLNDYKKGIEATATALELGLSGASLLGAYSNYMNWANSANVAKKTLANLLQKAQLPMQVGGTMIDAYQTFDAMQNKEPFETYYNASSMGLGAAGSVGASDVFLNSRFHNPKVDRVLDVFGILQNTGDFIKFGYDTLAGDNKNVSKGKHAFGGNLFDGTSQPTQQMQLGSAYWKQQARKPIFTTELAEFNKRKAEEGRQRRKEFEKWAATKGKRLVEKSQKDYLTTSNDNTWVENRNPLIKTSRLKNPHLTERSVKGAKAHAAWEKEHPVLNTWENVLGAVPFAVAAAPLAAAAGSGIAALGDAAAATSAGQAITAGLTPLTTAASTNVAGAPLYTWADVGLSSLFGAHGIQTAIDEGGISPETALEIAPLGRLAKPMLDAGKQGLQYTIKGVDNATRYASPSYDLYRTVDETPIINRSFPTKSLYRADVYKGGEIKDPHNISLTTDPKYAEQYGEVTPYLFESNSIAKAKEPLMGYSDPVNNDMFIYHNTKDVPGANAIVGHDLVTGEFPYNSKGTEIISLSPDNIYPKPLETPTIEWTDAVKPPKITSENAASMTPEQWTAAQDAAIAKGDMAEARRLRDLHFKTKAPNTKITNSVWHGSRAKNFNTFDLKYFGKTDGGVDGYGFYFGSKKHATAYKNPREFYLNMENPYTGNHAYYFNREKFFKDNELYGRILKRSDAIRYKKGMEQYKQEFLNKDGVIDTDPLWGDLGAVYVIPKSNQIKLVDAVTYNDNGVRIPLGERDNFKLNDIRYGLLPFGIGLTGYGLFNNQEALGGKIKKRKR